MKKTHFQVLCFSLLAALPASAAAQNPACGQFNETAVPVSGRQVLLPGQANAVFPAGAFPEAATVVLRMTCDDEIRELFSVPAALYEAAAPPYALTINTGKTSPQKDITVTANVPPELLQRLPGGHTVIAYIGEMQGSSLESSYNFDPVRSDYDSKSQTATFKIHPGAFDNSFTKDGTFEALIMIGSIRK